MASLQGLLNSEILELKGVNRWILAGHSMVSFCCQIIAYAQIMMGAHAAHIMMASNAAVKPSLLLGALPMQLVVIRQLKHSGAQACREVGQPVLWRKTGRM